MKVDFLATWEEFLEATRHHQFFKYQEVNGEIIIRAGANAFRYPTGTPEYDSIRKWCEEHAFRVKESIPEELVFA
jgi:hypothetical protein